jgi:four helix bundle protein
LIADCRLPIADCRFHDARSSGKPAERKGFADVLRGLSFYGMNPPERKLRTKQFALRIIQLTDAIPKATAGRAIAAQIVSSGTPVAANYRASCRARSQAEFIAKIGTVEEEADETAFWLELLVESGMRSEKKLSSLLTAANELAAIMAASRKTAAGK